MWEFFFNGIKIIFRSGYILGFMSCNKCNWSCNIHFETSKCVHVFRRQNLVSINLQLGRYSHLPWVSRPIGSTSRSWEGFLSVKHNCIGRVEHVGGLISGMAYSNWITHQCLLSGERLIQRNASCSQYSGSIFEICCSTSYIIRSLFLWKVWGITWTIYIHKPLSPMILKTYCINAGISF